MSPLRHAVVRLALSFRRRFRRPIGVIAERLPAPRWTICRFAIAADKSLPVDERQQRIAESVLSDATTR
jgi:hypothetical protein